MPILKQQFLRFLNQITGDATKFKYLLAVSGGKDSMLLMHLYTTLSLDFEVAHCNFGLRGKESDADQKFVESAGNSSGQVIHTTQFDTEKFAKSQGISTQMAARKLRYEWFEEILNERQIDFLVSAHHLNDSLETILLNLSRGTGISGLTGITPKNNRLIRPLLCFSREEIDKYVADNTIEWREDASNASVKYKRNKIRHEVVPVLKSLNESLLSTFERTNRRLNEFEAWFSERILVFERNFLIENKNGFSIKIADINAKGEVFLLKEWLNIKGFKQEQIEAMFASNVLQGSKFIAGENTLVIENSSWELVNSADFNSNENTLVRIEGLGEYISSYGTLQIVEVAFSDGLPDFTNAYRVYLNAEKVKFPLSLRLWQKGEKIQPFGMNGQKKISDILIDKKIGLTHKNIPVLIDYTGEIIWLIGLCINHQYRLNDSTSNVLEISFFRN